MSFRKNWRRCYPANLFAVVNDNISKEWIEKSNHVKEFYIGNEEMQLEKHFGNITNMLTDAMFTYSTDYTVRLVVQLVKI